VQNIPLQLEKRFQKNYNLILQLSPRNLEGLNRGCHKERGWNQQIMMLENGRFHHSLYLGIYIINAHFIINILPNFLRYITYITIILRYFPIYFGRY
jgi:hypothetical protein